MTPHEAATFAVDGRTFFMVMASDVHRDGMGMELHDTTGGEVVAEVFYWDRTATMTVTTTAEAVPLEAMERLLAVARDRLPPAADADGLSDLA